MTIDLSGRFKDSATSKAVISSETKFRMPLSVTQLNRWAKRRRKIGKRRREDSVKAWSVVYRGCVLYRKSGYTEPGKKLVNFRSGRIPSGFQNKMFYGICRRIMWVTCAAFCCCYLLLLLSKAVSSPAVMSHTSSSTSGID
jgi:hypothetical protein